MITVSACLIVKNEERVLARCLDSLKGIADEVIIIDTGSTDGTKKIAEKYTDKIYNFQWIDDFSAARNYSFSKATMEYIYVADADEVIDEENRNKFLTLKKALLPEIEIVQMLYTNQLLHNTTYNYDEEYRPKLYKRVRNFTWKDPIHESVYLEPVIYDSDIKVIHLPENNHAGRDFNLFKKVISSGDKLSDKLFTMYAKELYIAGSNEDFLEAEKYFEQMAEENLGLDQLKVVQCILSRCARIKKEVKQLLKYSLKNVAVGKPSAEVCFEVGEYFYGEEDYKEAVIWFYNAAYETESELNIHYSGDYPLKKLSLCYEKLGEWEQAKTYGELAEAWTAE